MAESFNIAKLAVDDVEGVHYPRIKLAFGPACSNVSNANPLPVNIVSGGGSSGGLTDAELRASAIPVSGSFYPVTQPVSGTFWQATQPISGTVGVSGSVAVTGAFYQATQPVSGTVSVSGSVAVTGSFYQATQPVSIAASVGVTGTFWQSTQPVSIAATVAVSGPLTDTQLRNSAVPVSLASAPTTAVTGTFWQATQPISGTITANAGSGTFAISAASLPLPTGAATETTLAAISTKTPALGQAAMAASSPVVIASNQSAVPVSGTFFQVTQPVSIASMPSTPVTGTFWQTTQPVSGTVTANAGSGTFAVSGTFWQATQPVSGTFWQATQPVSIAATVNVAQSGTWNVGTVTSITNAVTITPPTLTKGTQSATGLSTQDLKDAGRAIVNAATAIAGITAVTTEALLTLAVSRDGAATSNVTTIAVTSGKRLRIIGIVAGVISTAAAVISARVSLRMNPSGAAAANSPILAILCMSQQAAALAQAGDTCVLMFPEAIEISGTMQVGLSQVASVTTGTIWASLIAYEY